jgi:glutamine synthetase
VLAPGKDAKGNLQFVTFFVNVLAAVQKHNALLKASIASATNAHRLGANEAPPAIVSAFLGRTMTEVLHKLLELPSDTPIEIAGKKSKSVGLVEIPEVFVDNTDRNRTSPFAFTGNRFEFRAVGSCANCAGAMTTLNAAVAEQLIAFKAAVDKELAAGKTTGTAIMDALKPIIRSVIDVVCFDGNGYTEEWKQEAIRRGLDVETNVPKMFCEFTKPASVEMFTKTGVYTEKELEARNEVKWETYVKKVQIESRVMVRMALNHIVPAALEYKAKLLKEVTLAKGIYGNLDGCTTEMLILDDINKYVEAVRVKATAMREARKAANMIEDIYERALAYHDIAESLYDLRKPIDKLEELVDNRMWPLPKYRELLFIS